MRSTRSLFFVFLFLLCLPQFVSAQTEPTDAYIKGILQERVEKNKRSVGIVVGVIGEKGSRVVSFGKPDHNSASEVNGESVFEIGSVTKVFTSLILADMVEHGELSLNDPISKFLPRTVRVPARNGREITLLDLATQTSGLPRLPGNLKPKDTANPYADYTVDEMYDFLSHYTLTRDIGSQYEYSNLGVGLLGHVLALRAGTNYETLVTTRIAKPLGMDNTRATLSPQMQSRLALGHDERGKTMANWDIPTLAGAGALRSTANDMLKFAAANMGLTKTSLYAAMQKTHAVQRPTGAPDLSIGLGWHILTKFGTEIVWHNGGTGGYHSFIGFDKAKHLGVVVLSNSTNDIDDIGRHLLESKYPLAKYEPPKEHKAITVDPKIFDAYVGEYQLTPAIVMVITKDADKLFAMVAGQAKIELLPESETDFFTNLMDAQISFVKDATGQVTNLVLHQNGQHIPAKKIK